MVKPSAAFRPAGASGTSEVAYDGCCDVGEHHENKWACCWDTSRTPPWSTGICCQFLTPVTNLRGEGWPASGYRSVGGFGPAGHWLPPLAGDWKAAWSSTVTIHDSCPEGHGECEKSFSDFCVATVGRYSERGRFKVFRQCSDHRCRALGTDIDPFVTWKAWLLRHQVWMKGSFGGLSLWDSRRCQVP